MSSTECGKSCGARYYTENAELIEPAYCYDRWEKITILTVLSHIIAHPRCLDSDSEPTSSSGVPNLLQDKLTDDCSQHLEPPATGLCAYCAVMQCRLLWHKMSRQTSTHGWYSSRDIHQKAPRALMYLIQWMAGVVCL
jgi:hypothetical protein